MDRLAGAFDASGRRVDLEVVNAQHGILHLVAAPNQGPQPGQQFL
jgi:hypothetical protein